MVVWSAAEPCNDPVELPAEGVFGVLTHWNSTYVARDEKHLQSTFMIEKLDFVFSEPRGA